MRVRAWVKAICGKLALLLSPLERLVRRVISLPLCSSLPLNGLGITGTLVLVAEALFAPQPEAL